jgi:predicted GTPase
MQAANIGTNTFANNNIHLTPDDRPLGVVLVGQTGHGKSSLME